MSFRVSFMLGLEWICAGNSPRIYSVDKGDYINRKPFQRFYANCRVTAFA